MVDRSLGPDTYVPPCWSLLRRTRCTRRNRSTVARTVFPLRGVAGRDPTLALTAMMLHGQDGWRRGERRAVWHKWGCIRGLKTDQKRQRADEAESMRPH